MNINVDEILKKTVGGTIKYIFPAASPMTIAKKIASLANDNGGILILGIKDDGADLHLKGYPFGSPEATDLKVLMNGFNKFEIFPIIKDNKPIFIIEVEKENNGVQVNNEYPTFINERSNKTCNYKRINIFVSYNHKVSEIAILIEDFIRNKYGFKVVINRDVSLVYKDDIEEYMKSIKQNDIIISLISDEYLKSEACMYEVTELMRNEKYIEKLIFIVLNEEDRQFISNELEVIIPNVYGMSRYKYIEYWVNQKRYYSKIMEGLKDSFTSTVELNGTIKRVGRIADEIGEFLDKLNRLKGKNFTAMQNNDFEEISSLINKYFKK